MRSPLWFSLVVLPWLMLGCSEPCETNVDCGQGAFCSWGACKTNCASNLDCGFDSRGNRLACSEFGECLVVPPPPPVFEDTTGADDPPGSGTAYVINSIKFSSQRDGFDLDDQCTSNGCADNKLHVLGPFYNDQLRQSLLGGETLLLLEVAGLDGQAPSVAQDVTLRIYAAGDADDPFFPANNFKTPPGYDDCCEFVILPRFVNSEGQARYSVSARIEDGRLTTQGGLSFALPLSPLTEDDYPDATTDLSIERGRVAFDFTSNNEISGRIGGAAPFNKLVNLENPYCRTISPRCPSANLKTLLELFITQVGPVPDIDIDGDGLECAVDSDGNGEIDVCCDGSGSGNPSCQFPPGSCANGAVQIQSFDPESPRRCSEDPRMADGYSLSLDITAVRATIVGIR